MGCRNLLSLTLGILLFHAASAHARGPDPHVMLREAAINSSALQPGQQAVVAVVVQIKEGFHAQSHTSSSTDYVKFELTADPNPAFAAYAPVYPPGANETYQAIDPDHPLNVYTGNVTVYVPIEIRPDVKPGPLTISGKLHYQVCDDKQCYFPADTPFSIETKVVAPGETIQMEHPELFKDFDPATFSRLSPVSPSASGAETASPQGPTLFGRFELRHNSYVLAFIAAFAAGIIFNAVPCVLPVLPLKAIGFYEVSQHNRARSLAFGATFSLGLIASFAVLAIVVVVKQYVGWGQIYSNLWFNLAIVVLLLVMAVGTFGAFALNLPPAVYSFTPRHDTYLGNFLFGILTAILSTPCTFGLFVALLVWAADQPAGIGVPLIMTVGAGMAFPYFLLSAFPELARRFPRTGPWSELVKQLMAFLLLGSAVFFARRFLQPLTGPDAFWWLLFAVAAAAAVYLVWRTIRLTPNIGPRAVSAAIAMLIVVAAFLSIRQIVLQPYIWTPYSQEALEQARKSDRVVVVEFTAAWCSNCQYLEVKTLHAPSVVQAVKKHNVEMLRADLTSQSATGWPLLKQVNPVPAIPFTVVYGPSASQPQKLAGIYSAEDLRNAIEAASRANVARG